MSEFLKKGKWTWSKCSNVTISLAGKTTANAIAVAITSYIPAVGPAAGAFATIIIQNKVKTGYFKRRVATKLDTDPRYHWQKTQVSVYKDKARKKLLKTKTTGSVRKIIHN